MNRFLKKGLYLVCSAQIAFASTLAEAHSREGAAPAERPVVNPEQALKSADQIGSRVLVTLSDGTQKTLKDLITTDARVEKLTFHIPEYGIHLRMKAKPAKSNVILILQVLDAEGHETDRMTEVKIDPTTDQAEFYGHLKDCMRVLSAAGNTAANKAIVSSRRPAALCRAPQPRDEQLRNLLFDISLVGSGVLMATLATGPDFAMLKLPVGLLGIGLAFYGIRLIHADLLPACPPIEADPSEPDFTKPDSPK